jgi:hypothetical protein
MIADPSLRFWLHAIQQEGALYEFSDDVARTLLPAHLCQRLGLPELSAVTADPDAADEDSDVVFLVPGHPVLENMAARVIEHGDVGYAYLPWPSSVPPSAASLLERARAAIDVEHGRIDLAGDRVNFYRPLLRAGVLVTYTLEDHFQEREEVWADACAGVVLEAATAKRLRGLPLADAAEVRANPSRRASLVRAVGAVHRALLERIAVRSEALARQSRGNFRNQIERSEAYYDAAVAALERRRAKADAQRQVLLAAQSGALAAERVRRRYEIEAKSNVSHSLQPYRMQLVHAPALILPVAIRRGERHYPFELCWLFALGEFLPPACPSCGTAAPLVAERERLSCVACTGVRAPTNSASRFPHNRPYGSERA